MAIKLYKASSFAYTPFDNIDDLVYLKKHDIVIVDKITDADIVIAQNYKHLKKYLWRAVFGKKFLIWTLEPRFDTNFTTEKKVFFGLFKYRIMNVFTNDVFVSNITFTTHIISKEIELVVDDYEIKSRKIISLMSYYQGINQPKLIRQGENIDLIGLRSKIALVGNKLEILDVYGKGWPEGVSKEDSRDGDWGGRKKLLLADYNFNLCFENTASYNYMTEKIWDSIENYCLPIYYGKNTNVYEVFPKNSFIDYAEFNSVQALFDFVNAMTNAEFTRRMNSCIKVYNSISSQGLELVKAERKKMLDIIVEKVSLIYSSQHSILW
jgi:hypothetical protein